MAHFIGIDFGTHKCSMAVLDGDNVHVIQGPGGEETMRSTVSFSSDGVLVGDEAARQTVANPDGTITGIKRLVGRKFHSHDVQWLAGGFPFPVVAAPSGDVHVHVDGETYSPEEVTSFLLERLRTVAEQALGSQVDAVVTVPSWWDELARRGHPHLRRSLAGLRVKSLINATSAAADHVRHPARTSVR